MNRYGVTIIKDCHAAHNVRFRDLALLEAQSIKRLAEKSRYLVSMREEKP